MKLWVLPESTRTITGCSLSSHQTFMVFGVCIPAIACKEISGADSSTPSSISISISSSSIPQQASILKSFGQLWPGLYLSLQWKHNPFFLRSANSSGVIRLAIEAGTNLRSWIPKFVHRGSIGRGA
ncbi:hypothetical protein OWV82_011952 [Melia azedarach]|uniref:Uncharacterized protein n=1 Tax=Melia azedarach TaxID=155640 RepID=A0ACC1Y0J9_MELAZ|nr:hypothetical protein OWV82_011952 [Melia azedarach]